MKHVQPTLTGKPVSARRLVAQERKRQKAPQDLARLRMEAAAEIGRLIAFMDATDGYSADELEPSLGFLEQPVSAIQTGGYGGWPYFTPKGNQEKICEGLGAELEDEHDGREDGADDEPRIGYDAEIGVLEDDRDDEPSLGWPENFAQHANQQGGLSDRDLATEPDGARAWARPVYEPGVSVDRGVVRTIARTVR